MRIVFRDGATALLASEPTRLVDLIDEGPGPSPLPTACRSARCGVCLVRCLRGAQLLVSPSAAEQKALREVGAAEGLRLGCQLQVDGSLQGTLELEVASPGV